MSNTKPQLITALLSKVRKADAGSAALDCEIWCVVNGVRFVSGDDNMYIGGPQATFKRPGKRNTEASRQGQVLACTRSLDAARDFVARHLPNFYVTSGLCELSGHASIGPDYNGSQGDRLKAEWDEDKYHSGFSADLVPGGDMYAECLAIVHCVLQALIAKEEIEALAA